MLVPYTDASLYPTFDISTVGVCNRFIAGFIVLDSDNDASWGGYYKTKSDFYTDKISKLRSKGGDIDISFGGASGVEIAVGIQSVDTIFGMYKQVVEKYNPKSIDFDIEGPGLYDLQACMRRGEAITKLKKLYPKLKISLTLPVMPDGLGKDALDCAALTPHDMVNIMAMDFGREPDMGQAVINALLAVKKQTQKEIGVTVMIGKNDTLEVFTLADAKQLKDFCLKNKWVKRISFWSIERDRGENGPLATSSQITQKKWDFVNLLK